MQPDSSSAENTHRPLAERGIAAIKWNYLGVAVRVVAQLAVQIALARLLGPDALGLFALVMLCIGVGGIIVDLGLGSALVQAPELTNDAVRYVFDRVLVAGAVIGAIVFISAPLLGSILGDERIVPLLRSISPIFLLQALAVVPGALLRRDLMFKPFQVAQIGSYIGGFLVVGVGLALAGAGIWSLVWAWLTQATIAFLVLYRLKPFTLGRRAKSSRPELQGFGLRVLFTNIANWCIENVDNLLVGKLFGAAALGYYSVSYNLVRTPTNHLVTTVQSVLFPVSARAHTSLSGLRRAYTTVLSAVALLATPVFAGTAVVAPTIVTALFGPSWTEAAAVLLPLSLAMILHAPMALAGPVLAGSGQASTELKIQAAAAALLVAALLLASQISFVAVGWAVLLVYATRLIAMTVAVVQRIELPLAVLLRAVRGGMLAGCLIAISLYLADTAFADLAALSRLLVDMAAGSVALALFIVLAPRWAISPDLADLVLRLTERWSDTSFAARRIRRAMTAVRSEGPA